MSPLRRAMKPPGSGRDDVLSWLCEPPVWVAFTANCTALVEMTESDHL